MNLFDRNDFSVFDITGFEDRMHAIRERIRPRLEAIGTALAPAVSEIVDEPVYAHVARHARRTVNPPDDTWVAFGPDKRGYKKDVHFRIAVSRNCVRLLFEVGPDYYDKRGWVRRWRREAPRLGSSLIGAAGLGWYRDEHDEEQSAPLTSFGPDALGDLGRELLRRREGQIVIGRRVEPARIGAMKEKAFRTLVAGTFRPLAPLYHLHEPRLTGLTEDTRATRG